MADFTSRSQTRRFRPNTPIFSEGLDLDRVMLLVSGRVKVSSIGVDGQEYVLALRGPGDLIGELSALDGEPRSATVTALEPVEALVMSPQVFRDFLVRHPAVALQLLAMLSRRLRDADSKRVEFGALDTPRRVANRLVELAETCGKPGPDGVGLAVPITQRELAGWIGSSREAVSKALHFLRARGIVQTRRGSIVILDLEVLRRQTG
jgi:CRP/FNR family transcriptional regulator, cyclic AMP receptor protein